MRILVVDDMNLTHIVKEVAPYGFSIDEASSGKKALELAASNTYDIIILDYELPDMNGAEIVDAVRKLDRDVYIIGYSGYWENLESLVDDWSATELKGPIEKFLSSIS